MVNFDDNTDNVRLSSNLFLLFCPWQNMGRVWKMLYAATRLECFSAFWSLYSRWANVNPWPLPTRPGLIRWWNSLKRPFKPTFTHQDIFQSYLLVSYARRDAQKCVKKPKYTTIFFSTLLCVPQAGRDESDKVDEALAAQDAKVGAQMFAWKCTICLCHDSQCELVSLNVCCRKSSRQARLDGERTRWNSSLCSAWGTVIICYEVFLPWINWIRVKPCYCTFVVLPQTCTKSRV